MENTSGQGSAATVPPEIMRWNWGAFLLNWIWGVGNNTYLALLVFLPLANIVMPFVLGVKGSEWAWKKKKWESVAHFQAVQKKWAMWGSIFYLSMVVLAGAILFAVIPSMKNSEIYKLSVSMVEANSEAVDVLGKPISFNTPTGSFDVSESGGKASFSFNATGKNDKETIFIEAVKEGEKWIMIRSELVIAGSGERINLNKGEDDTGAVDADLNSLPAHS